MSTTIYAELFCQFCSKACKNKNSQVNHQRLCKSNPNRQSTHFQTDYNKTRKPTNQFIKAEELGLEKPIVSEVVKATLAENNKLRNWDDEAKQKHSLSMKQAVLENPESYTKSNRGRVKHIKKYGLTFDGEWELKFYEWCMDNNIKIEDNTKFFPYVWNEQDHLYNPDFYLPEYDVYVEVKGYYDDRDIAKWDYFTEKLSVLKKDKIKLIEKNELTINDIINNLYK
jgi:hypothetical protein